MTWATPTTAVAGTVAAAADFNNHRDDLTYLKDMAENLISSICEGRLTLTTATPVTTSDVTAASTLYFTPFRGNRVSLYDGSNWDLYEFTERSLNLDTAKAGAALDASLPHDIFLYDSSGTLTLEAVAWTNTTTRATALTTQDGVYVKNGATDRRYLGTICTTSVAGDTEDSETRRFVWNYYHRVVRSLKAIETTDTWTYTTATWRAANNNTTAGQTRLEFVVGVSEDLVAADVRVLAGSDAGGNHCAAGIALDATNANHAQLYGAFITNADWHPAYGHYRAYVAVGYHYLQWVEYSTASGTTTWVGDWTATFANEQGGMLATLPA